VSRDGDEAHLLEKALQPVRLWGREFDKFESVCAQRIVEQIAADFGVHAAAPSGSILVDRTIPARPKRRVDGLAKVG
jgi:hypothetical protein